MPSNPGKLAVLASIGLLRDRFFALLKLAPSSVKVSSMTKSFSWKALAWIPFLAVLSCGTSVNESGSTKIDFVMNAPNPNHVLTIQRACERDGTLFVLARVQVRDPNAMAASVITELSDAVVVPGHFEDVERYLVGKTWSWHDSPVMIVESGEEFDRISGGCTDLGFSRLDPTAQG